ncbi:MAG: hypothetical protein VYB46_15660 [Pseudomonadota bacterium]|nr:hypothetical protein [Pseudomonadota bacterium]
MARGFLTGVVHGGLLGGAALAVLSLLAPLPRTEADAPPERSAPLPEAEADGPAEQPATQPQPETDAFSPPPADTDAPSAPLRDAAADGSNQPDAPDVAPFADRPSADPAPTPTKPLDLDLPAGSEFGRGGDLPPVLPEQGSSAERAVRAEPLSAPVQEAVALPPVTTLQPARPETQADGQGPLQPDAGEGAPALTLPAPTSTDMPRTTPATLAQPEAEAERDVLPQIAPEASGSPDTAPRLPRPALDLSLPPDLTDLRRLERN